MSWSPPRAIAPFKGQRRIKGVCTRHGAAACSHPKCAVLPDYESSDSDPDNTDLDQFIKFHERKAEIEARQERLKWLNEATLEEKLNRAKEATANSVGQEVAGSIPFTPMPREPCAVTPGTPTMTQVQAPFTPKRTSSHRVVAAVVAEDLADTPSSAGPLTVFAPTNDAFGALPAGVVGSPMPQNEEDEDEDDWGSSWGPNKTLTVLANSTEPEVVKVPTGAASSSSSWTRGEWHGGKWHYNKW